MNVLILGAGYIGTAIYEHLHVHSDCTVEMLSKSEVRYTDKCVLNFLLSTARDKYDVVINCSGYTGRPNVDACEDNIDDTWYYNVVVPGEIARVCRENDVHLIHVSSGCIYDGYEKEFAETDEPNFGIKQKHSSWYSKSKHAGELAVASSGASILRIRMPFCATSSNRNVLTKLLAYDYIINQSNSMTNVEDFVCFVSKFLERPNIWGEIYNVVNPQPVPTSTIINTLKHHGLENPKWQYISLQELFDMFTTARRSNCVLSTEKLHKLDLELPTTIKSLDRCATIIKNELDKSSIQ